MMVNSNLRKQILTGWLREQHEAAFASQLKLQKFLFFYEVLSKMEHDQYDFYSLQGYQNGPVFGTIYGDYTYEYLDFREKTKNAYLSNQTLINLDRAKLSAFLVQIMTETELSEVTHAFDIWKKQHPRIQKKERHVPLYENDLSQHDIQLMLSFKQMYPISFIDSVEVIHTDKTNFVISKEDKARLSEDQRDIFLVLSEEEELVNPVHLTLSEDGVILVD